MPTTKCLKVSVKPFQRLGGARGGSPDKNLGRVRGNAPRKKKKMNGLFKESMIKYRKFKRARKLL